MNTKLNENIKNKDFFSHKTAWSESLYSDNYNKFNKKSFKRNDDIIDNINNCSIEQFLLKIKKAEDWISLCFEAEVANSKSVEKLWIAGIEKFHGSVIYLENLGFYYYRKKQFHKALQYLKNSLDILKSCNAVKIGVASAYALSQYHLVWDYYNLLNQTEQKKLEDELLNKVAISALHQSQYKEAENIFIYLRNRKKLPELPSLEESLLESFETKEKMNNWMSEMDKQVNNSSLRKKLPVYKMVTYASVLIYRKQYKDALILLTKIKSQIERN
ncbi:MAG: hypothetical protein OEZ22_00825 [Spirochaetia bacterium]|nr:hypothetical protein [Spirochaetia bacterium]